MPTTKKFSTLQVGFIVCAASAITFLIIGLTRNKEAEPISTTSPSCNVNVKLMDGFSYIKPLMFVDEDCQSDRLGGIRQQVLDIINRYQREGNISKASIYLRDSDHNDWMGIDEEEKFLPGSLLKVPLLMVVLKTNEDHPGFLDKKITFNDAFSADRFVLFPASHKVESKKTYTVRELLKYAIKYSDNNATLVLEENIDLSQYLKLFKAVGLQSPNINDAINIQISPKDYSLFMRSIYNASYLTIKDSEFAAELLSECEFKEGIMKGLPTGVKAAHKFGEAGNDGEIQLHESALIYLDNNSTYLLTVMTKAKDKNKQTQFLQEISRVIYNDLRNLNNS